MQLKKISYIPENFLYTNVFEDKNKIFAFGYDVDTKQKVLYSSSKIHDLSYFLPTNDKDSKFSSFIGGIPLKKYNVNTIKEYKDLLNNNDDDFQKIYGFNNIPLQFLCNTGISKSIRDNIDLYLNATKSLINIGIFDIETDIGDSFPDPMKAEYKVTAISIYCTKTKNLYILADKPLTPEGKIQLDNTLKEEKEKEMNPIDPDTKIILRVYENSEEQMLVDFGKILTEIEGIDILTGWNSDDFDVPYLCHRANKLFGEGGADIYSPYGETKESFNKKLMKPICMIKGLSLVDSMEWYKNFTRNIKILPSYSLNYVCDYELGCKKAEIHTNLKLTYEQYYDDYINYNMIDVIRLVQLINCKKFFHTAMVMMYKYYCVPCIERIHSPVVGWESIIYYSSYEKDKIFPPRGKRDENAEMHYPGAYVHKPDAGFYKCLVSFDVNSMYPHIQIGWNISPETWIGDDDVLLREFDNHPALIKILELRDSAPEYSVDSITQANWWDKNVILPLIHGKLDISFLKLNKNICMTPALEFYWIDTPALVPSKLQSIYADRKVITREEDALSIEAEKIKKTDEKKYKELCEQIDFKTLEEIALKIVINAEYGANGFSFFYFYNIRIARSITITGRYLIMGSSIGVNDKYAEFMKNEFGVDLKYNSRCYNDTDSTYYTFAQFIEEFEKQQKCKLSIPEKVDTLDWFGNEIVQEWITDHFYKATTQLNAKPVIVMKRECIALDGLYREIKKNYCLLIYDKKGTRYEKPKMYLKGSQFVSISIPKKCKQKYDEILYKFVGAEHPENVKTEITKMIKEFREQFKTFSLSELCQSIAVNSIEKYVDEKGNPIKGATKQVKAAVAYNKFIKRTGLLKEGASLIQSGQKVRLIPLKKGHPYGINVDTFAFIDELPKGFDTRFIDYEDLFQKNFLKYFTDVLTELKLKWDFSESNNCELDDDLF
jgi:DNA polymerase elongation subunit (family B)